ncbi:MAG TPA: BatA domain-containing protein [Pirellulales bacterium]|jgi:hypothetical protein|nr:BatA domain-containing protein [Pirellulales bacterium]
MPPSTPLFGFGFGAVPMLWWLVAAGAPLVIYLWTKRRYREVPWAAMEYLLAAIQKNARRVQLEQWLLLLIRTLIVVCVVLALAEPYWQDLGLKPHVGERAHKVIVIDASYSMAYKPTDVDRFERAKELAAQIVAESAPGDGFTLLELADPPRVVVGTPSFERQDLTAEIKSLKLLQGGGDLPGTIEKVQETLDRARREQPKLARQEVYFLTDLGRNTWGPNAAAARSASALREHLQALKAANTPLVVIDLGQPHSENLAITDLRCLDPYFTVGRDLTLEATVKNYGRQVRTQLPVEFLIDGRRQSEQLVDLRSDGEATASMTFRFDRAGPHTAEAKISGDLLDLDNHRWLSLPVQDAVRVLLVDGSVGEESQSASYYLRLALDPDNGANPHAQIQPEIASEGGLTDLDLKKFDCIYLCNVGQFTAGEAKILERYLQQGGGLVFFLGDRVNAERYNRELGNAPGGLNLLPGKLDQPVKAKSPPYAFNPLDYKNPIVVPFRGREDAGLLTTPTFRYFRVEPSPDAGVQVALAFDSGDPAILEKPAGRGRVVLVTIPAAATIDPDTKYPWTMWPRWPSFLPLVKEILATAVNRRGQEFNVLVGREIGGLFPVAAGASLALTTPDGRTETVRPSAAGDRWTYQDTYRSGLYQATYASLPNQTQIFSVNLNTAESDLTKLDASELPPEFIARSNWQDLDARPALEIAARESLQLWFLYPLLALVLLETFVAWRIGRRAG